MEFQLQRQHNAISTGTLRLDLALGGEGVPRGQISEIAGPVEAGKTVLCLHMAAEAQVSGGLCAWIDADFALNRSFAVRCGVQPESLYVAQPQDAESAYQIAEILTRSGAFDLVVLDSLSSLALRAELQAPWQYESEDPFAVQRDRLTAQALHSLKEAARRTGTAVVLTLRPAARHGAVYHNLAGNPAQLALNLCAAVRLILEPKRLLLKSGEVVGIRLAARVVKCKMSPGIHPVELDIMYNGGIARAGEIFDLGTQVGLITQVSHAYWCHSQRLGASAAEAVAFLRQDGALCAAIEEAIRRQLPSLV